MQAVVFLAAAALVLALAGWAGHRSLKSASRSGSGTADALGNFIDVFDPARARADRDLQSKAHQGEPAPSPDDAEESIQIDRDQMKVTIKRSRKALPTPSEPNAKPPQPAGR